MCYITTSYLCLSPGDIRLYFVQSQERPEENYKLFSWEASTPYCGVHLKWAGQMGVFRRCFHSVSADRDGQNVPEEWHSLLTIKCCRAHRRLLSFCGSSFISTSTYLLSNSVIFEHITRPYYLGTYSVPSSVIHCSLVLLHLSLHILTVRLL